MHNILGRNIDNVPPMFLAKKFKKNFNNIFDVFLWNITKLITTVGIDQCSTGKPQKYS
jgi:hypothetical protein